jgi:membrane protease subunit HflK
MYLETMERLFGGTEKIIIDSGVAGTGQGVLPILPLNELMQRRPAAAPPPPGQQSIPSSTVREVPRGGAQ